MPKTRKVQKPAAPKPELLPLIELDEGETHALVPTVWYEICGLTAEGCWVALYQYPTAIAAKRGLKVVMNDWDAPYHEPYEDFKINPPTAEFDYDRAPFIPTPFRRTPDDAVVTVATRGRGARRSKRRKAA